MQQTTDTSRPNHKLPNYRRPGVCACMRACVRACVCLCARVRACVRVHVLMCCTRTVIKYVGEREQMLYACSNAI